MSDTSEAILAAARERAQEGRLPYFGALTPSDAYALLRAVPKARLIDVRTRAGMGLRGPRSGQPAARVEPLSRGTRNPEFLAQFACSRPIRALRSCFSAAAASRSDGAARVAAAAGYAKAFNVLEGFEGDKDADGHRGTLGGWRKAGLPWVQG